MNRIISASKRAFLVTGIYALACLPAVLLAERSGWSQRPLHLTQSIAVLLCLVSSAGFLWSTRGLRIGALRWLASAAVLLCGLWLMFLAYVLVSFDLSGMG